MSLSHDIVRFIDHLHPLYMADQVDGVWCARSLCDGTLIVPIDEPDDDQTGFVTVHWQGDASRQTVVQGVYLASLAVARYVETNHVAQKFQGTRGEMERMSAHFTVKTGHALVFDAPSSDLLALVAMVAGKAGESVVMDLLKKQIGL